MIIGYSGIVAAVSLFAGFLWTLLGNRRRAAVISSVFVVAITATLIASFLEQQENARLLAEVKLRYEEERKAAADLEASLSKRAQETKQRQDQLQAAVDDLAARNGDLLSENRALRSQVSDLQQSNSRMLKTATTLQEQTSASNEISRAIQQKQDEEVAHRKECASLAKMLSGCGGNQCGYEERMRDAGCL